MFWIYNLRILTTVRLIKLMTYLFKTLLPQKTEYEDSEAASGFQRVARVSLAGRTRQIMYGKENSLLVIVDLKIKQKFMIFFLQRNMQERTLYAKQCIQSRGLQILFWSSTKDWKPDTKNQMYVVLALLRWWAWSKNLHGGLIFEEILF